MGSMVIGFEVVVVIGEIFEGVQIGAEHKVIMIYDFHLTMCVRNCPFVL